MQNNTFSALFVGQKTVKLKEIDSTNNYLKNLLSNYEPVEEGTVIMADYQFAGRGQHENKWQSKAGENLTFSIYLKPNFLAPNLQFYLNKSISLGVADCITQLIQEDCYIKWPNDIFVNNSKIGGILIENTLRGNLLKDSVIGIGLNINQKHFDNLNSANSLANISGKNIDLVNCLNLLCKCIESRYLQLKNNNLTKLNEDYQNHLYRLNIISTFLIKGFKTQGIIKGVDKNGRLLIEIEKELKHFDLKEIALVI